jgi:hypothetical protein
MQFVSVVEFDLCLDEFNINFFTPTVSPALEIAVVVASHVSRIFRRKHSASVNAFTSSNEMARGGDELVVNFVRLRVD